MVYYLMFSSYFIWIQNLFFLAVNELREKRRYLQDNQVQIVISI